MLIVYPRTNKQNQKKKRKVEPPTPQVTQGHTHTLSPSPLPPSEGHDLALILGSIPLSNQGHQPSDAACVEGESWGKPGQQISAN